MRHVLYAAAALGCAFGVAFHARPAHACGGCFHGVNPTPERESVVTDHRMVFSIARTQTVLWDQIRYTGDPGEFAWVLPVHPGAHVELSHDAWLAALDASTQPVVTAPQVSCPAPGGGSYSSPPSYSSGGGGGCGSSASYAAPEDSYGNVDGGASGAGVDAGFAGNDTVSVVSQDVIGPYETVTVRASNGQGLEDWLTANGFAVPPALVPTITAYTSEGFDFIALKLRPGAGVRAMQPVRIVSPGADPSMPLRMVAAGIGANVGITLFVVGEGRYHTQNFPDAPFANASLKWDPNQNRSNYQELTMAALQGGDGRGFLTESAGRPSLAKTGLIGGYNPGLGAAYYQQCLAMPPQRVPCATDAGPPVEADASADSGGSGDAGEPGDAGPSDAAAVDATPPPPGDAGCFTYVDACSTFDDIDVATSGMYTADVWVTRLRAFLPANSLAAGDLRLEASPVQSTQPNVHVAASFSNPSYNPCPQSSPPSYAPPRQSSSDSGCVCTSTASGRNDLGTYLLIGATLAMTASLVRRRRRR